MLPTERSIVIPKEFGMAKDWEYASELYVRLVAIPVPPTTVQGIIFDPESYSSKVIDTWKSGEEMVSGMKMVTSFFDPQLGPVFLVSTKLRHLLTMHDGAKLEPSSRFGIEAATFCGSVSFWNVDLEGDTYADGVQLDRVQTVGSSCHPGSHYSIPRAPYLTALLQFNQGATVDPGNRGAETAEKRSMALDGFEYLDPDSAELLFPTVSWECNRIADDFVSKLPFQVWPAQIIGGPGAWVYPYLTQLRRNKFLYWQ
jgi:hypothetical protein